MPEEPKLVYLRGNPQLGQAELIVGMGDHTCIAYKLTHSHLKGLAMDAPRYAVTWGDWVKVD